MKVEMFDTKGKKQKDVIASDAVFAVKVNEDVLAQYVYAYLSNQRQANAHTKDRSEVAGSRSKPWRQKGTGRARVGTKQNPIWKGGGVAFGPKNIRNFKKRLNKKFKKAAMRQSLSTAVAQDSVKVVDTIAIDEKKPLAKQVVSLQNAFDTHKLTIVTELVNKPLVLAAQNIKNVQVVYVQDLNPYDILTGGLVLLEDNARKYLESTLVKGE